MWKSFLLYFVCLLSTGEGCIQVLDGWKQVGLEERAKRAPIVFHGLAIETLPSNEDSFSYSVQFWLINVYKGSESVGKFLDLDPGSGGVFNLRDRKINVTGFTYKSKCHSTIASQKYYIIFCELRGDELVAKFDDLFGASAEWSERNEKRVWHGVGWDNWSDWGTCSVSCGEGSQERSRKCTLGEKSCHGYNKERRRCNMFSCQGAVDPMKLDDRRFFHPSRGEWQRVSGRPSAWKLRPNSYVWVPSSQIFSNKTSHRPGIFPREFSLLVTLKLSPKKPLQGTLFSLRSRREQNAYLSLELEAPDRVRVVHAGKNGTQAVIIPMKLNDGYWHQLGLAWSTGTCASPEAKCPNRETDSCSPDYKTEFTLTIVNGVGVVIPLPGGCLWYTENYFIPSLQDDNSVRSFLDCAWVSTDILKRNELDHPEDADLIIGYLFQGELEQLVIIPNPGAVAQQCSSSRIPIFDPTIKNTVTTPMPTANLRKNKHRIQFDREEDVRSHKKGSFKENMELSSPEKDIFDAGHSQRNKLPADEDSMEGSGNGLAFNKTNYEIEWSDWSPCSTTCGPGVQTRYSRCVDDGSQLELCVEAGSERTETRSCILNFCQTSSPDEFSSSSTSYQSNVKPETVSTHSDFVFAGHLAPTDAPPQNFSELKRDERQHLTDEILFPPDIYFFQNHTVAGNKLHNHNKMHNKRIASSRSWDILKRRLLRGNGSKKNWCSCLNGGTCDHGGNFCRCPEGFWGRFCENLECQIDCLNGGRCLESNMCSCPTGFHGSRCEIPKCDPPCRNGGTCIKPNTCLCPAQTAGSYCQKYFCRSPCLNGGICVGPDQCECPHNATGKNCENPVCEPPCENGATCSPGNWCLCNPGSYGIRCERRKCEYVPVKEPFTRGFKRLVSKKTETKCEPLSWKTCVRTVPEYQTVYKTFYRTVYKCKEEATGDIRHQ